jgi:hypothetical protein
MRITQNPHTALYELWQGSALVGTYATFDAALRGHYVWQVAG